jgi:hypothetical protein
MGFPVINPHFQFFNNAGEPLDGGFVETFEASSSTPKITYRDADLSIENDNPIELDSAGRCSIFVGDGETFKYIVKDVNGVTLSTQDKIKSPVSTQSGVGTLLHPLTQTEIAALATPINYGFDSTPEDVRRYGAVDTGGATDSTDEIQDAFDALNAGSIKGGGVWFAGDSNSIYNVSDSIVIPARTSGDNHTRWYSVRGMGRGAPRIRALTGMADKPILSAAGSSFSAFSFYREFKDMYLDGNGIANRGVELYYNQHYKVENLFITLLDDGSSIGSAAGVRVFGAICSSFRDIKVHDGDGYGIHAHGGSGSFFNANLVEGCSFLFLAKDGFYASGGWSGNVHIGNTHEFCANYGMRLSGFSATCGFIGGNYLEANGHGDFYIGEDTFASTVNVIGNYLNGYTAGPSQDDYTPIKIKFGVGVIIRGNTVAQTPKSPTGYLTLDANISGGSVSNCIVENNLVKDLASSTAPNSIYNLPGTWVDAGNALIDPTFAPLVESNLCRGRWPNGGWTLSATGSGVAAVDNSTLVFGAPSLRLNRPAASTASATQTFSLDTGSPYKNRFCTFSIPVRAAVSSSSLTIAVVPNGTSPQTTTIDVNTLASGTTRIVYVMVFVPSDATTIAVTITANATSADFYLGEPCLYIGARQWYTSTRDERVYFGQATYDPGSLADGAGASTTVTVTGAALGDFAAVSFSLDLQGITLTAYVSAADTVTCRFQNETTGTLDLASGTLRAKVTKV